MSSYWVNFITSGDPNGKGLPQWPAYSIKDKQVMMLGDKQDTTPIPDQAALDFISTKLNRQ
jgi:para-nitrobenzyl esterase